MLIVYTTRYGNVERFVKKLDMRHVNAVEVTTVNEPFVLVTSTCGFGEVPEEVTQFLSRGDNASHMTGVASSGNMNWGTNFAIAADLIAKEYGVPIILKFELAGVKGDLLRFKERMQDGFKMDRTEQPSQDQEGR